VMCHGEIVNQEIIDNLQFLLLSAKERGLEQGVASFSFYIEKLSCANNERFVYEELYCSLSGMQRFADFTHKEWQAVQFIIRAVESSR
ncbi:hypothetical protein, partial [Vibrio vulnificus]|uniref:hypothetical protein n=1 Tax=Vibrio vulnificus TaxID=672 RepID=UPI001A8F2655